MIPGWYKSTAKMTYVVNDKDVGRWDILYAIKGNDEKNQGKNYGKEGKQGFLTTLHFNWLKRSHIWTSRRMFTISGLSRGRKRYQYGLNTQSSYTISKIARPIGPRAQQ